MENDDECEKKESEEEIEESVDDVSEIKTSELENIMPFNEMCTRIRQEVDENLTRPWTKEIFDLEQQIFSDFINERSFLKDIEKLCIKKAQEMRIHASNEDIKVESVDVLNNLNVQRKCEDFISQKCKISLT